MVTEPDHCRPKQPQPNFMSTGKKTQTYSASPLLLNSYQGRLVLVSSFLYIFDYMFIFNYHSKESPGRKLRCQYYYLHHHCECSYQILLMQRIKLSWMTNIAPVWSLRTGSVYVRNLHWKYSRNPEFCVNSINGSKFKTSSEVQSSTGAYFSWEETFILFAASIHVLRKEEKPPINLQNCSLC